MVNKRFNFVDIRCSTGEVAVDYDTYLHTNHWRLLRERLYLKYGKTCQRCHKFTKVYQLHHLTYERIGHERDKDLRLVCIKCHEQLHKQKDAKKKRLANKKAKQLKELLIEETMIAKPLKFHTGKYYNSKEANKKYPVIIIKIQLEQ